MSRRGMKCAMASWLQVSSIWETMSCDIVNESYHVILEIEAE